MPRTIRFHLDEHAALAIAEGLQRRGIDVTTTPGAGLVGASDDEQLAYIRSQGRVIFTEDADFLRLHSAGEPHPGITCCKQQSRSIGDIIRALVLVWEYLDPFDMQNRVEFL
jgi:predicted nuclease of predicted toxin-antitoxin system